MSMIDMKGNPEQYVNFIDRAWTLYKTHATGISMVRKGYGLEKFDINKGFYFLMTNSKDGISQSILVDKFGNVAVETIPYIDLDEIDINSENWVVNLNYLICNNPDDPLSSSELRRALDNIYNSLPNRIEAQAGELGLLLAGSTFVDNVPLTQLRDTISLSVGSAMLFYHLLDEAEKNMEGMRNNAYLTAIQEMKETIFEKILVIT